MLKILSDENENPPSIEYLIGLSATMGIFDAAMGLGMIVGPLVSGVIMEYLGIGYVFSIGGLVSALGMCVFMALAGKDRPAGELEGR